MPSQIPPVDLSPSPFRSGAGGAIKNDGNLIVIDCKFSNNQATTETVEYENSKSGGAIYNSGTATLVDSVFTDNRADGGKGGAIYNMGEWGATGELHIIGCAFHLNHASAEAGAIYTNHGILTVVMSLSFHCVSLALNAQPSYFADNFWRILEQPWEQRWGHLHVLG